MLLQSEGFVLQSLKYGESSQISKIFTKEKGLLSVISSRSKSKKSRQANYFQPLTAINFVCYLSNKSNIHRIKEVSFNTKINSVQEDIALNALRFFLAEFMSKVIREEEQNFSLYDFVEQQISLLFSKESDMAFFHIQFLLGFCDEIGITPDIEGQGNYFDLLEGSVSSVRPVHDEFLEGELKILLEKAIKKQFSFNKRERLILLNLLIRYYNIQLDGGVEHLKSKAVLEVVFS